LPIAQNRRILYTGQRLRTRDAGAMADSALLSYLLVDLHLILTNSAQIHLGSDIQCELLQWVKKLKPKPKLEQTWPLRRMTPSPWRLCRVVSRAHGSLPRTLNWKEALFAWPLAQIAADPDLGVERAAGPAAAILGQSDVARGRCFGFKFGRWLATLTERVHSRSPCGARVRDECTKRSGRSGWTVEHFVLLGCLTTRSFIEVHSFWRETMIQTALSNLQDATDDDHWALRKSGQYTLVYGCLKYSKKRHFAPLFSP
jgi:hypothetical protein